MPLPITPGSEFDELYTKEFYAWWRQIEPTFREQLEQGEDGFKLILSVLCASLARGAVSEHRIVALEERLALLVQ